MSARRGVLTGGTWCVDLNKSIRAWPREDTMNTIASFERQGGGSGCNMAIDLKRLDPSFPVETMGVIGDDDDGRFLRGQCEAFGIEHAGLQTIPDASTAFSDCFNSLESGRRTHFYGPGVAAVLSPDYFDFTRTNARIVHLGLPGAHAVMDGRWKGDSTGWATVLRAARAAGLETNLEMVSTDPVKVRAFGLSCVPHLDLMIVNDYEIGCVADVETRDDDGRAIPGRIEEALGEVMALGPVKLAVVHFPEGAIAMTLGGSIFALGSLAMPAEEIAGVNGAGDAFAAGMLYGWHEGWEIERGLRLGHACAGASMRDVSTTTGVLAVAKCLALADRYGHRPTPT